MSFHFSRKQSIRAKVTARKESLGYYLVGKKKPAWKVSLSSAGIHTHLPPSWNSAFLFFFLEKKVQKEGTDLCKKIPTFVNFPPT